MNKTELQEKYKDLSHTEDEKHITITANGNTIEMEKLNKEDTLDSLLKDNNFCNFLNSFFNKN